MIDAFYRLRRSLAVIQYPSGAGTACPELSLTSDTRTCDVLNPKPCNACSNGVQDGGETDVDCGGYCDACMEGQRCAADADCTTATVCGVQRSCIGTCTYNTTLGTTVTAL